MSEALPWIFTAEQMEIKTATVRDSDGAVRQYVFRKSAVVPAGKCFKAYDGMLFIGERWHDGPVLPVACFVAKGGPRR